MCIHNRTFRQLLPRIFFLFYHHIIGRDCLQAMGSHFFFLHMLLLPEGGSLEPNTDFYDALRASRLKVQYDHHIKRLLSFRPIVSRVLSMTLREYRGLSPEDAAALIEPEHTDSLLLGVSAEDAVPEEGSVRYDLRFSVCLPSCTSSLSREQSLCLLINLEAQKNFYRKYRLVTRGIFYAARMLSSQLGREFRNSNYQKLKKVCSIWICMNAPVHIGNSLTEYRITKHDEIGCMPEKEPNYDKLSVILICLNTKKGLGKPGSIHHFLNVLLSPSMEPDEKERILSQMYGIAIETELRKEFMGMCNLGEAIEENALKKGRSQGRREGSAESLVRCVEAAMASFHIDLHTACEGLGFSMKEYDRAKKLLKG